MPVIKNLKDEILKGPTTPKKVPIGLGKFQKLGSHLNLNSDSKAFSDAVKTFRNRVNKFAHPIVKKETPIKLKKASFLATMSSKKTT